MDELRRRSLVVRWSLLIASGCIVALLAGAAWAVWPTRDQEPVVERTPVPPPKQQVPVIAENPPQPETPVPPTGDSDEPQMSIAETFVNSIGMRFQRIVEDELAGENAPRVGTAPGSVFGRYISTGGITREEFFIVMGQRPRAARSRTVSRLTIRNAQVRTMPVKFASRHELATFCERLSMLPEERARGFTYRLHVPQDEDTAADRQSDESVGRRILCEVTRRPEPSDGSLASVPVAEMVATAATQIENGLHEHAQELLEKAHDIAPNYVFVYALLAECHQISADAATERGDVLTADQQHQKAYEWLDHLESANPAVFQLEKSRFMPIYLYAAKSYAASSRFNEAVNELRRAEKAGFADFAGLKSNPQFAKLVRSPEYPWRKERPPASASSPKRVAQRDLEKDAQRKLADAQKLINISQREINRTKAKELKSKGIARLEDLIKSFPETTAAANAQQLLSDLK